MISCSYELVQQQHRYCCTCETLVFFFLTCALKSLLFDMTDASKSCSFCSDPHGFLMRATMTTVGYTRTIRTFCVMFQRAKQQQGVPQLCFSFHFCYTAFYFLLVTLDLYFHLMAVHTFISVPITSILTRDELLPRLYSPRSIFGAFRAIYTNTHVAVIWLTRHLSPQWLPVGCNAPNCVRHVTGEIISMLPQV